MTRFDADMGAEKRGIPERMCVTCRAKRLKSGFIRVYRAEDGAVMPDETGGHFGRGAYVCRNPDCVEKAIKQRRLERNLKAVMTDETARRLREAAIEGQR